MKPCSVCGEPATRNGLCTSHYMKKYRADRQQEWYDRGMQDGLQQRQVEEQREIVEPRGGSGLGEAEAIRQEMYHVVVRLYRELRMACPIKYSNGVLTVSAGKAQRVHEFGGADD